jgi:glycosyltransferase involved in cell wall biosynthesis
MILDLTIAIPVLNDAANLGDCLRAIGSGFAKRVVVVDSGSTDSTRETALAHGAEFLEFRWDGRFPKKRNWFLRNHPPSTRWVLFLDADEVITEEFKQEVRRVLPSGDLIGYWLSYSVHFLGKRLRGGYPLKKLALFRVGAGEYERIDEDHWSHLDMEVHEHPVLSGKTGWISARIDHRDDRCMERYVAKHNEYSSWESARLLKAASTPSVMHSWTWKQRLKFRLANSPMAGPVYFLGSYLLMGGFLDGGRGLVFAILKASYFCQVYCKLRELRGANRG